MQGLKKRKSSFERPRAIERTEAYPLYKLVCTGFRETTPLAFLLFPRGNCSDYGSRIAVSLVNLAATRIFSEPEQSILELPVNSLDAYSQGGSVGKFGLGFFSILYWLVGHPRRSVNITSVKNRKRVYARVQEVNGVLCFQMDWDPNRPPEQNGTHIVLDCRDDPLPKDTLIRFSDQLLKLKYMRGADLQVNQFGFQLQEGLRVYMNKPNLGFTSYNNLPDNPNKILVELNPQGLSVRDFGRGLSLKTLVTKMLVPTVSIKSFQLGEETTRVRESLYPRLEQIEEKTSWFMVLVRSVAVVNLKLSSLVNGFKLILDLPGTTPIPVSRDDILLTPFVMEVLSSQLQALVDQCVVQHNLQLIEEAVATYIEYTANENNKAFFQHFLDELDSNHSRFIRVHYQNFNLLNNLTGLRNPFVNSLHQDTEELIDFLEQQVLPVRRDIFFEKVVAQAHVKTDVYRPDNQSVTNAMLPFFLFVDFQHPSYATLPVLYPQDKLYLKGTEYATSLHSYFVESLQNCYHEATEALLGDAPPVLGSLAQEIVYKWTTFWDQNKYILTNIKYTLYTGTSNPIAFNSKKQTRKAIYYLLFDLFSLTRVAPGPKVVTYMYQVFDILSAYAASPVQIGYGEAQETQFTLQDVGFSTEYALLFSAPQNQPLFQRLLVQLSEQGYVVEWGLELQRIHKKHQNHQNFVNSWSFFHPVYFLFFVEQMSPLPPPQNNVVLISLFVKYLIDTHRVNVNMLMWIICLLDCVCMSESEEVLLHNLFQTNFDTLFDFIQQKCPIQEHVVYKWLNNNHAVDASQLKPKFVTDAHIWTGATFFPIILPRVILEIPYSSFLQSHLVHYVVTHEVNKNLITFFQDVEHWESEVELKLPVTEIAINEGSSKSFANSVVTETIQNSLDAIRSVAPPVPELRCEVGENSLFYIYKITDFVGLSPENVLPLMIPFLSSKKASGQTTGEMGSGFFNLYRESELVIIDSTLNGERILIVDEPILNSQGRVVDIGRRVQVLRALEEDKRQTDIYVCMGKGDTSRISSFVTFIRNVLPLISGVPTYLNNELLHIPTAPLLETELFLGLHISKPDVQSYVFTKGVPFMPLRDFLKTSELFSFPLSEFLLAEFQTGLVVHLKQNVFTPVQTRARISLLPGVVEPLKTFLFDVLYLCLLTRISERSVVNVNNYLPHFTIQAPLIQLLPSRSKEVKLEGYGHITKISPFLVNRNFPGTTLSFSDMVHKVFTDFGENYVPLDIIRVRYQRFCPPLLLNVLTQWFQSKNVSRSIPTAAETDTSSFTSALGASMKGRLLFIFTTFVNVFWKLGIGLKIKNFENRSEPLVEFEEKPNALYSAMYKQMDNNGDFRKRDEGTKHTVFINLDFLEKRTSHEERVRFLNVFNTSDYITFMKLLQSLERNPLWKFYFENNPGNMLVHELEHARRNEGVFYAYEGYSKEMQESILHAGSHDSITTRLAEGLSEETYTFDESSLTVYKLLLSNGFFKYLHGSLMR